MKKLYKTPETEVLEMTASKCILEQSGESGTIHSNESKTFEEGEISSDMNPSSGLWDD